MSGKRWSRRATAYSGMAFGAVLALVAFLATFPLRTDIQLAFGLFGIMLSIVLGGLLGYGAAAVRNWAQRRDRFNEVWLAIRWLERLAASRWWFESASEARSDRRY